MRVCGGRFDATIPQVQDWIRASPRQWFSCRGRRCADWRKAHPSEKDTMMKLRLFTPGPTMVSPEALLEMAYPLDHHRTSGFKEMLKECTDLLAYVYQTSAKSGGVGTRTAS